MSPFYLLASENHSHGKTMNQYPSIQSLSYLKKGEKAVILEFSDQSGGHGHRNFQTRMEALGLRKGTVIEVLVNDNHGPVMLRVAETRVALGRGMAEKVKVEYKPNETK